MKFDVYCDESRPDLFTSQKPNAKYVVIGSLWMKTEDREQFKLEIHGIRNRHRQGGEFKWQKASPSRTRFYRELLEWFFAKADSLRFRCIAVDQAKVDLVRYHENDQELGFYKFYYQMLHHWIMDFNEYVVFCDAKKNRDPSRLKVLRRCLDASNLSSAVTSVQANRSNESVLVQLSDVLTGAAAARLNDCLRPGSSKSELVALIEAKLGRRISHTVKGEQKFNVFVINLDGGW